MFRTHQSSQPAVRSILTRHENLKTRNDTGVFYIGLGDQFDDNRRLVRETASALRPTIRPTWAGASHLFISS
jgi:hypothetical protein